MAWKNDVEPRSKDLEEALDRSLALLEQGSTTEDCLARFPEQAEDLRPLLEMAVQIRRVPAPTPSDRGHAEAKARMLDALEQRKAAEPGFAARLTAWVTGLLQGRVEEGIDVRRLLPYAAAAALVVLIASAAILVRSWQGMMVRQQAVLTTRDGLVEVLPSGADEWLPVADDIAVQSGDRIRTGALASAELVFFDGSETALGPQAELSIARMAAQRRGDRTVIELRQWLGETRSQVEPLVDEDSRFSLETASAVMLVRGTSFSVGVDPDGTTRVEVHEGSVEVRTVEMSTLVEAGEEVVVSPELSTVQSPTPTRSPTPTLTPTPMAIDEGDESAVFPTFTDPTWESMLSDISEPSDSEEPESSPSPTATGTLTPTASHTPTATATPTATLEPPSPTPEPPTDTPVPPPTEEPTEEPRPTDFVPPGQTKTPPGLDKKTPTPED